MAISQSGLRFISEFHKDVVKSVAALPAPSAALAGFRRFRTSDNIEFFCDGAQWLSTQRFSSQIIQRTAEPFTAAGGTTANLLSHDATLEGFGMAGWNGIYVDSFAFSFFSGTAQSGTNFYTLRLFGWVNGGGSANVTMSGNNTQAATTINQWRTIAATVTPVVIANTIGMLEVAVDQNNLPGNFFLKATAGYRRVG